MRKLIIPVMLLGSLMIFACKSAPDTTVCEAHAKNCPKAENCPEHPKCEAHEKCAKSDDCKEHPECEAFEKKA